MTHIGIQMKPTTIIFMVVISSIKAAWIKFNY